MFSTRAIIAVIVAGIAGTIANSFAITALAGAAVLPLIFSLGRNLVAIIVAFLLPLIYARMTGFTAHIVSFLALTIIPSILAKTVFAAAAPWGIVLGVNAVYAVVAIIVYVLIVRAPATR